MITNIDVASQALGLCRANPISSFNEGTNEADIISLYYDTFIKDIFTRHTWSFSIAERQINQDAEYDGGEYKYAYIIPSDCLRVSSVYSDNQGSITKDFRIQGDRILTNNNKCFVKYSRYIDEDNWDGAFMQYAIHALASLICLPLTDDENLANLLTIKAYGNPSDGHNGGLFGVAKQIDAQQSPIDLLDVNEISGARFL
jgi:hypothetical protein